MRLLQVRLLLTRTDMWRPMPKAMLPPAEAHRTTCVWHGSAYIWTRGRNVRVQVSMRRSAPAASCRWPDHRWLVVPSQWGRKSECFDAKGSTFGCTARFPLLTSSGFCVVLWAGWRVVPPSAPSCGCCSTQSIVNSLIGGFDWRFWWLTNLIGGFDWWFCSDTWRTIRGVQWTGYESFNEIVNESAEFVEFITISSKHKPKTNYFKPGTNGNNANPVLTN